MIGAWVRRGSAGTVQLDVVQGTGCISVEINASSCPENQSIESQGREGYQERENGGAPNQVIVRKLPSLEEICKLVPLPTSPEVEGKPEFV